MILSLYFLLQVAMCSNALCEALVESLCDTTTPEMEEPPQEVGWEPSHTQMPATAAAPKEAEAMCSEQKTNWIKLHFPLKQLLQGLAVYWVRHMDLSSLLGKQIFLRIEREKTKHALLGATCNYYNV